MAMLNPCHPGEILRDNLEAAELSVTEAASRLGCTRQALSRLLNGRAGISRKRCECTTLVFSLTPGRSSRAGVRGSGIEDDRRRSSPACS